MYDLYPGAQRAASERRLLRFLKDYVAPHCPFLRKLYSEEIDEAWRLKPDVVVLNVTIPILNGFETARKIKTKLPESAIVILSLTADRHLVEEAKRIGARAYLAKSVAGQVVTYERENVAPELLQAPELLNDGHGKRVHRGPALHVFQPARSWLDPWAL